MIKKILCAGLIMEDILMSGMEKLPEHWEETVLAYGTSIQTGGGAANSALTLGKIGIPTEIAGRIGNDRFADLIINDFHKHGVSTKFLKKTPKHSTGTCVGLVNKNSSRCFITSRGANSIFSGKDFNEVLLSDYSVFFINGFFQFPDLEPDLPRLFKQANELNVPTAFDTASWDASGRWFKAVKPFANNIDFFFANETQLSMLSGKEKISDAANFLLENGVKHVIAKLGPQGCVYYNKESNYHINAYPVNAIDTTGAGDSFDAAFLAAFILGNDIKTACAFANLIAACNCTKLGATTGIPSKAELNRLLKINSINFKENNYEFCQQ